MWSSFFGKQDIEEEDSFFDMGGDSLKALILIGRINRAFNVKISIKGFLNNNTIAELSILIEEKRNSESSAFKSIPKSTKKNLFALSSAQKRLYFVHQLDQKSLGYNSPKVLKLEGQLDKSRLEKAIQEVYGRHSSLRTTFVMQIGRAHV